MTPRKQSNAAPEFPSDADELMLWADPAISRGKLAMAFVPTEDVPSRTLWAMSLAWSNDLIGELAFVREAGGRAKGTSKIELPYSALRAALHIRLQPLLRLDASLGLSFLRPSAEQQPVFALLSGTDDTRSSVEQTVGSCLRYWLSQLRDFVRQDAAGMAALARAEALIAAQKAFVLKSHGIHTLPWQSSPLTHTTAIRPKDRESDRYAYAALAEEAAISLVGHELLPGAGKLRRVLDGDPGRNQAVLLTPPISLEGGEFSFCVSLHVETVPAFGKPLIVFDVSKRRWVGGALKDSFGARTIRGHVFVDALPDRVLSFSAQRTGKVGKVYQVETCDAFSFIAGTYDLPLDLTSARRIALRDYPDVDLTCQVRLTYANGITSAAHPLDVGIPERDWVDAFKAAAEILQPIGLVPLNDLQSIRIPQAHTTALARHVDGLRQEEDVEDVGELAAARKVVNVGTMLEALRSQYAPTGAQFADRYGFTPEHALISKSKLNNTDHGQRLAAVQAINRYAIKDLNGDRDAILLLIYDRHYAKSEITLVKDMASVLFGGAMRIESSFLPPETHGPQVMLPENGADTEKRFKTRVGAWKSLAERVRAVTASGDKVYCLVMAPEWYPGEHRPLHDDVINKAAARHALVTLGGAMSQYLLPIQKTKDGKVQIENFNQRVQSALKDLLLAHSGSAIMFESSTAAYFAPHTAPKEIVGITVVRNQGGRVNKSDTSFVLTAFRQRADRSQCEVRFAYSRSGSLHITGWEDLANGVATIAAQTPAWLSNESDGRLRQAVAKERYQEFVKSILDECSQRKSNAVVLIDSTNAASLWPWLTDQRIDPNNISIGTQYRNMQRNWEGLRIVRVRQQIAPLVVEDKIRRLREREDGPVVEENPVPSSPSGLFKVGKSDSGPQAFWSVAPTGSQVKRGSSCYRPTRNTKRAPGTPHSGWLPVTTVPPHIGQWPTPNAVEFTIGLEHPEDETKNLAGFCHTLRWHSLHYDDSTALPVPLFFEKVVRQYIAKFALGEAVSKENEE